MGVKAEWDLSWDRGLEKLELAGGGVSIQGVQGRTPGGVRVGDGCYV